MTYRKKSTPEDDRLVRDDAADWGASMAAIDNVAADHLFHLEPEIARHLDHEFEGLRAAAISCLLMQWKMEKYLTRALDMLRSDPGWGARHAAASAVAWFAATTDHPRQEILRALALALQGDSEEIVAREAYDGLVLLLAPERQRSTIPEDGFDKRQHVDWKLIEPYLPS